MSYKDKTCVCRDCGQKFMFTMQEQAKFKDKGLRPPTRCPECHDKRNSRRNYSRGSECKMYVVPCSACGKDAELPFKPTEGKPAYCEECFKTQLDAQTESVRKEFVLRKPERLEKQDTEQACSGDLPSFADFKLDERLEHAIEVAGFDTPTPVQAATIPIGLKGRDLIGTAQTGTGKTAAFVLPILQHLLTNPVEKRSTRVIVLTPTRELAEQINEAFYQLGRFTKIKTATVYGGVNMNPQEHALRNGTEVIVACPGRLLDHIERGNTDFSNVEKLVLDEADRMLDMGFLPSIKRILSHMPAKRHTMLFSATFAEELTQLAKDTLIDPQRVDVDICAPAKTVAHALYPCPQHLKTSLVLKLLEETDTNSVLIFTRTKHRANRVAEQIRKAGYGTAALHANKSQSQRQLALDDFRSGRCQVMVATDIAARGLDVETISHVINYDIPDTADTYIHRIGRTGRAEREGDAMTLITREDASIVWEIEKTLGASIERRKLEDFDYDAPAPARSEFKRAPMPQRKPRQQTDQVKASSGTRGEYPAKAKAVATSPSHFFAKGKPKSKRTNF